MNGLKEYVMAIGNMGLTLCFSLMFAAPFIGAGYIIGVWAMPWYLSNHFVMWDTTDMYVMWMGGLMVFVCVLSTLSFVAALS